MLLPVIQNHDLIPSFFFKEEKLGRIGGGIMRHGIDSVNKFQQYPDSQDNTLVRLGQRIDPHIVAASNIGDHQIPFKPLDNPLRLGWRLIFQQANHLRFGQCPILGQPAYDMLFFLQ